MRVISQHEGKTYTVFTGHLIQCLRYLARRRAKGLPTACMTVVDH